MSVQKADPKIVPHPTALVERLSDDDLAYHETVFGEFRAAQAAAQSWLNHLGRKHGITSEKEIAPDGRILRPEQGSDASA